MYTLKYEEGRKKNLPTTPGVTSPLRIRITYRYLILQEIYSVFFLYA